MPRRILEALTAAFALIILSPLLVLIALAVKLGDGGTVFYAHSRIGKNFQPFLLLKFRTMTEGADRAGSITVAEDARITRVGRLLRQSKLDELPQLFNVFKGDMQFVGTRPEVEHYVNLFRSQYAILLQDLPGITDPASILYRREEKMLHGAQAEEQYVSQILPDKLRISLGYRERRTLASDLRILLQTVLPFRAKAATAKAAPKEDLSAGRISD